MSGQWLCELSNHRNKIFKKTGTGAKRLENSSGECEGSAPTSSTNIGRLGVHYCGMRNSSSVCAVLINECCFKSMNLGCVLFLEETGAIGTWIMNSE